MDMQQQLLAGMLGKRYLGEVHRSHGRTVVAVLHQLFRNLDADVLLSLFRASSYVRGKQDIIQPAQGRNEFFGGVLWLDREYVHSRATQVFGIQRFEQSLDVDYRSSRRVNDAGARLHSG